MRVWGELPPPRRPSASCEWACCRVAAKNKKLGGERGIRTLGTPFGRTHDFQSCSFSQLGHLSVRKPWFVCQKSAMTAGGCGPSSVFASLWQPRAFEQPANNQLTPLKAHPGKLAERVGFEPTCPAFHRTSRFRVDPVTATSVPLRSLDLAACGAPGKSAAIVERIQRLAPRQSPQGDD